MIDPFLSNSFFLLMPIYNFLNGYKLLAITLLFSNFERNKKVVKVVFICDELLNLRFFDNIPLISNE
jgi:hypothetical protein